MWNCLLVESLWKANKRKKYRIFKKILEKENKLKERNLKEKNSMHKNMLERKFSSFQ